MDASLLAGDEVSRRCSSMNIYTVYLHVVSHFQQPTFLIVRLYSTFQNNFKKSNRSKK